MSNDVEDIHVFISHLSVFFGKLLVQILSVALMFDPALEIFS